MRWCKWDMEWTNTTTQCENCAEDRLWPLREEEEEAPVSSTSSSAAAAALRPPVISAEAKAIAILHHGTVTLLDLADNYKQPLGIFRGIQILLLLLPQISL